MTHKILFLNWKDIQHPKAGGAEVVTHEIMQRLVSQGHKVTLLTAAYATAPKHDILDGIEIIRVGSNEYVHYLAAVWYYLRNLRNQYDIIVEEINTIPYFINLFKGREKTVLYYNQLCREIWFYQMFQPFSTIGFLVEPIYTRLQSFFGSTTLTISNSSAQDLQRYGFRKHKIKLFSMGIENSPLDKLDSSLPKQEQFTVLFHGSLRAMKRPMEVFKAFNILSKSNPEACLWVSGGGDQSTLKQYAQDNNFLDKVKFFGRTTEQQKLELMQQAHVLCATSVKEGWGLIVTEANSMGTPALAYDVDGLRDAAGMNNWRVVDPNPESLAAALSDLKAIINTDEYQKIRQVCLDSSKLINFDRGYKEFYQALIS